MALMILDLGATKLAVKLFFKRGILEDSFLLPKLADCKKEMEQVLEFLKKLLNIINNEVIESCVCSSAASIDRFGRIYRWPNRSYWQGYNIGQILNELFGVSVLFEDDGNLAAYAESKLLKLRHLIYLGIGSGISGGIVLNNQLVQGMRKKAAEFAHMSIDANGIKCYCGRHGCVQAYASGNAILKNCYAHHWQHKSKTDILRDIEIGKPNIIAIVDTAAKILARALININEILDINIIVIGGGFGSNFIYIHRRIKYFMNKLLRQGQSLPSILTAKAGQHSSLKGAEFFAIDQVGFKKFDVVD